MATLLVTEPKKQEQKGGYAASRVRSGDWRYCKWVPWVATDTARVLFRTWRTPPGRRERWTLACAAWWGRAWSVCAQLLRQLLMLSC
jgi:hypothetical protein